MSTNEMICYLAMIALEATVVLAGFYVILKREGK